MNAQGERKCVVLGVTGGIAAYKALEIVSRLSKVNVDVNVIMTKSAMEFVTPLSFQALSHNAVIKDMFEEPKTYEIQHIALAKKADLIAVIPASANIIGKVAHGIADDMLSTTIMAARCKVMFAPAMNTAMYENPILQDNIKKLSQLGYYFTEPDSGHLACGDSGKGKLADVDRIYDDILMMLESNKDFQNKKVIVTAGPTREDIDPVRFITNHSSGKMGYAVARAARNRGAQVTLISGPVNIKPPSGMKVINVSSAREMYENVIEQFDDCDIVIKCAAVADYRPETKSPIKIKKSDDDMSIKLVRNPDILFELGKRKKDQILVGFAAETDELIKNSEKKLEKKNLDMVVANDITIKGSGFNSDNNTVRILTKDKQCLCLDNKPKNDIANSILDCIKNIKR